MHLYHKIKPSKDYKLIDCPNTQMLSAGMRASGKHDVRSTVDQRFRAENQRGDRRMYTLRGEG